MRDGRRNANRVPPLHERDGHGLPDGSRNGGLLQPDTAEGGDSGGDSGEASIGSCELPNFYRSRAAIFRCGAVALVAGGDFKPSPTIPF